MSSNDQPSDKTPDPYSATATGRIYPNKDALTPERKEQLSSLLGCEVDDFRRPIASYPTPFRDIPAGVYHAADESDETGAPLLVTCWFDREGKTRLGRWWRGAVIPYTETDGVTFSLLKPSGLIWLIELQLAFPVGTRVRFDEEVYEVEAVIPGSVPGDYRLQINRLFQYAGPEEDVSPDRKTVFPSEVMVPRTPEAQKSAVHYPLGTELIIDQTIYSVVNYSLSGLVILHARLGMGRIVRSANLLSGFARIHTEGPARVCPVGVPILIGGQSYIVERSEETGTEFVRKTSIVCRSVTDPDQELRMSPVKLAQLIARGSVCVQDMHHTRGHAIGLPRSWKPNQPEAGGPEVRVESSYVDKPSPPLEERLFRVVDMVNRPLGYFCESTGKFEPDDAVILDESKVRSVRLSIPFDLARDEALMPGNPPTMRNVFAAALAGLHERIRLSCIEELKAQRDRKAEAFAKFRSAIEEYAASLDGERYPDLQDLECALKILRNTGKKPEDRDDELADHVKLTRRKGKPCALADCPPGMFLFNGNLGFKTEYEDDNGLEAYCLDSGEYFWGGTSTVVARRALIVTPLKPSP